MGQLTRLTSSMAVGHNGTFDQAHECPRINQATTIATTQFQRLLFLASTPFFEGEMCQSLFIGSKDCDQHNHPGTCVETSETRAASEEVIH